MPNTYTLSQLQNMISGAIAASPLSAGAWVTAELVDVRFSGGHCYMELMEKDPRGATVAKMRANIWRNQFAGLRRKFFDATGMEISSGMKVMVGGYAQNHPVYGVSFNIVDIDPGYTLGDMERLRREILDRLTREGVIGYNKSLEMPAAPQKIAVISSATAAGYGDFVDQLVNNAHGLVFYPHLFEAVMQGDRTSASVRDALRRIEMMVDLWDCVCIIRGGGATTDLNGFDDYELARAVATFPLPVVVGIGHERDRTVLDEIANVRIKTPTGVAAYFVERNKNCLDAASRMTAEITRYAAEYLNGEHRRLSGYVGMIPALADSHIRRAASRLDGMAQTLPALIDTHLQRAHSRLEATVSLVPALVSQRVAAEQRILDDLGRRTAEAAASRLTSEQERLVSVEKLVVAYSPMKTLQRGFSITSIGGKTLRSAADAKPGDVVLTRLADGEIISTL